MRVKIRYADKSLFEGEWADAPSYELETIAYVNPKGEAVIRHGGDFYALEDGEIIPWDEYTLLCEAVKQGYVIDPKRPKTRFFLWLVEQGYKIGTFVGPEKWQEIFRLGIADRDSLR